MNAQYSRRRDYEASVAPHVPTPVPVVRRMLELAEVKPGELLFDLGCGDGRIIVAAAAEFNARSVGVELQMNLVRKAQWEVRYRHLEDRVKILHGDFFEVDLSEADVVTLYLTPNGNELLKPKLEKQLKPGSRVVSNTYEIHDWKPRHVDFYSPSRWLTHRLYLYERP